MCVRRDLIRASAIVNGYMKCPHRLHEFFGSASIYIGYFELDGKEVHSSSEKAV